MIVLTDFFFAGKDLSNKNLYPLIAKASRSLKRKITAAGRGNVDSFEEVPAHILLKIKQHLANLQVIMKARLAQDIQSYYKVLNLLKPGLRNSHHHDISLGAQFIVTLFDVRRGQEGIQTIPKDFYEKTKVSIYLCCKTNGCIYTYFFVSEKRP